MTALPPARIAHPETGEVADPRVEALVNEVIGRVADKWTMLALEVLAELNAAKLTDQRGWSAGALAARLRVELGELQQVLAVLQGLDWVGRLTEQNDQAQARQVLLIDPSQTLVRPLVDGLLLLPHASIQAFAQSSAWDTLTVSQSLTVRSFEPRA